MCLCVCVCEGTPLPMISPLLSIPRGAQLVLTYFNLSVDSILCLSRSTSLETEQQHSRFYLGKPHWLQTRAATLLFFWLVSIAPPPTQRCRKGPRKGSFHQGGVVCFSQLFKANRPFNLWFSHLGPYFTMTPKVVHLFVPGPLGN